MATFKVVASLVRTTGSGIDHGIKRTTARFEINRSMISWAALPLVQNSNPGTELAKETNCNFEIGSDDEHKATDESNL